MPIVDITGFTADETDAMDVIRFVIQVAFQKSWGFPRLDTTSINFLVDPSLTPSLKNHVIARVYTKKFIDMDDLGRDKVCEITYFLMEKYGGHEYNEAFPPGYKSMQGRWNPDFIER